MFITASVNSDAGAHSVDLYVGQIINGVEVVTGVAGNYSPTLGDRLFVSGVVPAGARYYWSWGYTVNVGTLEFWLEFYEM